MTWTTIYNLSLDLMGERKSDGQFSTAELAAIAVRAPALATLLQAELLPAAGGLIIQATAPTGDATKLWINTTTNVASYWSGTAWVNLVGVWG